MLDDPLDRVELNDGARIPWIGLGTYLMDGRTARKAVGEALRIGYRLIDTASAYGNEAGVGKAISDSGLGREEIFVTSKVWVTQQGFEGTFKAIEGSLKDLGLDYLDLYLIHWPVRDKIRDTWKAMEAIRDEGLAISVGVCNFEEKHLTELELNAGFLPSVDQVETHPRLAQFDLHRLLEAKGIRGQAWSPLMKGGAASMDELVELSREIGKTPSQIALRWLLQRGIVVIPKTVDPARMRENFEVFDFSLTEDQMGSMDELDTGERVGPAPEDMFDGAG